MPSSIIGPLMVTLVAIAGLTVLGTIHEIPEGYVFGTNLGSRLLLFFGPYDLQIHC